MKITIRHALSVALYITIINGSSKIYPDTIGDDKISEIIGTVSQQATTSKNRLNITIDRGGIEPYYLHNVTRKEKTPKGELFADDKGKLFLIITPSKGITRINTKLKLD